MRLAYAEVSGSYAVRAGASASKVPVALHGQPQRRSLIRSEGWQL